MCVKDPVKLEFNKPTMKINPKAPGQYPVSVNILKSPRMVCIVIFQYQVLLHINASKVCICIIDFVFAKPSTVGLRCLP